MTNKKTRTAERWIRMLNSLIGFEKERLDRITNKIKRIKQAQKYLRNVNKNKKFSAKEIEHKFKTTIW